MEALSIPSVTVAAENATEYVPSVLCIGQDPSTCKDLQRALAGCNVVFVSKADEALRTLNGRPFDLYVLEYWLSDWSGAALCRDIRKADPHVPICFCTIASRPVDRQRAERAGGTSYIVKPADPELLHSKVPALLRATGSRNNFARQAASAAMGQELQRRFALVQDAVRFQQLEPALRRGIRAKACDVFLASRGTLAGFEAAWENLWSRAWSVRPR
jgi:DNA-binding response OmpR family regulator